MRIEISRIDIRAEALQLKKHGLNKNDALKHLYRLFSNEGSDDLIEIAEIVKDAYWVDGSADRVRAFHKDFT